MAIHIPVNSGVLRSIRLVLLLVLSLVCLGIVVFCGFYLLHTHQQLTEWYFRLDSCFYNSADFTRDFFTSKNKTTGNYFCLLALPVAVAALTQAIQKIARLGQQPIKSYILKIPFLQIFFGLLLVTVCTTAWVYGNSLAMPACDEVFSAQTIATTHPFQIASYYMLPNNHILFNLLNSILVSLFHNGVNSGRLISFACYLFFILTVYVTVTQFFGKIIPAAIIAMALSTQFFIWGFSFQARGYEFYLLCECGMVISLFAWLWGSSKNWLYLNTFCIAAGYFCMPSFLYLHAAQLVFAALYYALFKKKDVTFWKFQIGAVALTFLFYLPLLCFSGYSSVTNNRYVYYMKVYKTDYDFCVWMFKEFKPYPIHIFNDLKTGDFSWNIIACLFPLTMFFSGMRSRYFQLALFYLAMLLTFFGLVIVMHRLPFERNLIGHYAIVMLFALLTLHWLIELLQKIPKKLRAIAFSMVVQLPIAHIATTNKNYLQATLYEYDVNTTYNDLKNELNVIPSGSSAGYTVEAFYCRFINGQRGCSSTQCPTGNETYFIKSNPEAFPETLKNNYMLAFKLRDYEVYKHR